MKKRRLPAFHLVRVYEPTWKDLERIMADETVGPFRSNRTFAALVERLIREAINARGRRGRRAAAR